MAARWIRIALCALLGFDTLTYILSFYVKSDNEELQGKQCSLYPPDSNLPCMQYNIPKNRGRVCSNLSAVFPHVYSIDNVEAAWPGPISTPESGPASINWTAPPNGGVHYLKGFQIILIGADMNSYETLCTVIDLTNTTASDIRAILDTTFSARFDVPGTYTAEISPLPLPSGSQSNVVEATVPSLPQYNERHTRLKVVFKWRQTSANCMNYTLAFEPDVKEITEIYQEMMDDQNNGLTETYTDVQFRHKQIQICNLAPGNYTLQVTPTDPYDYDSDRCVCYVSTGEYKTCQRCNTNVMYVYIEPIKYYPDVTVRFNYLQTNASCFTYTLGIEPVNNNIQYIRRELLDVKHNLLTDASKQVEFKTKRTRICGLIEGNYTLMITPVDDPTNCICYNKSGDYKRCVPCHAYTMHVHLDKFSEPTNVSTRPVAAIVASTLVSALIVTLLAFFIIYKRRGCFFVKKQQLIENDNRDRRAKTIHMIYALDHAPHKNTVHKFANLIKDLLSCRVTMHEQSTNHSTSTDSLSSNENKFIGGMKSADVICCIHSEWSYKLVEKALSEVFYIKHNSNADDGFVASVHEISQNEQLKSKLISIHFDYTSPSFVIRNHSMGSVFSIPSDLESFSQQAHTMLKMKQTTLSPQETNNLKEELVSATEAVINYQKTNLNWVSKKLFDNQTSVSSHDDSGIILPRRTYSRYRSSRSRSAETTACSVCRCTVHSRRHVCSACSNHEVARLRTNSCDLSFYPPDLDYDEISVQYSLLENKFIAINDRYDYIVKHKFDLEEDCLTIDGKSV